jgi:hypothetical protein
MMKADQRRRARALAERRIQPGRSLSAEASARSARLEGIAHDYPIIVELDRVLNKTVLVGSNTVIGEHLTQRISQVMISDTEVDGDIKSLEHGLEITVFVNFAPIDEIACRYHGDRPRSQPHNRCKGRSQTRLIALLIGPVTVRGDMEVGDLRDCKHSAPPTRY